MNHSFYGADRATHYRVVGSACVAVFFFTLLSISLFAKSERQATSAPMLKAGMPVTTTDGNYFVIR
jgi:hypothetical protein